MQTEINKQIDEIKREINLRELPVDELWKLLDNLKISIDEFGDSRFSDGWDSAVLDPRENDDV